MNGYLSGALLLGLLCVVSLPQAKTVKHGDVRYDYYHIHGNTYPELLQALNQMGPKGHHALTSWHIDWSYSHKQHFGYCHLIDVDVEKKIVVIMPLWVNKPNTPTRLTREWDRYVKALKHHEEKHVQNAQNAQQSIKQALLAMKPVRGCKAMGKLSNQKARAILNQAIAADKMLDKKTAHGQKQGAIFRESQTH